MTKDKQKAKKIDVILYFTGAIIFSILVFWALSSSKIIKSDLSDESLMSKELTQTLEPVEELCFQIEGTPAWIQNKNTIYYGYNSNMDDVDLLIQYDIYFLYNPDCSYCKKQINLWGESGWMKYLASGKTINCKEVIRNGYGN
jgi:hypothetical protein